MAAYLFRMPSGIAGTINRNEHSTVEAQFILPTNPPNAYGIALVLDSATSKIRGVLAGDAATDVYGINVRPFPTHGAPLLNDPLGGGTPAGGAGITNVLRRGYISVILGGVVAVKKNGAVFVRVATPAAGKPVGGFEAAADGTNTIQLTNASFTGPADAQGNTEIAFNI